MKSAWSTMMEAARDEAVLAVDLYNQPTRPRRLEDFLVHMHIAWLYLLHAQFRRDGVDYHYRRANGWYERIDGEPKTWDLAKSVQERWPTAGAIRKNLELTIALRNRIEHRHQEAITLATTGYAQALLLNFEEELTTAFGDHCSLGEELRFPIFVGTLTALGNARIEELRTALPKDTRNLIARFEADLDPSITQDQRYEFRINLVPKLGPRGAADRSLTFVRESDLTDEEKAALQGLGRSGTVVIREQVRSIANDDMLKPSEVAKRVEERISFRFGVHHVILSWRKLGCRPATNDAHPERTDEKYCVYNRPYRDYLYKQAFIDKIVRETDTDAKFKAFLGTSPTLKT